MEHLHTFYRLAIVVLAVVAVWHLVQQHQRKDKRKRKPGEPESIVAPASWWSSSPVSAGKATQGFDTPVGLVY